LDLDDNDRPLVDVWARHSVRELLPELASLGADVLRSSDQYHVIEARLDIADLPTVALLSGVLSVTPVYRPLAAAGSVSSQGDSLLHADDVRDAVQFPPNGYDGTGVKIGVLSDSVNRVGSGLAASVASRDLPAGVEVLQDYVGPSATDEGRAMLEIVHDLAPAADLAFHTASNSELDFAQGIRDLAQAGTTSIRAPESIRGSA
jgi:hypothetical protein